jgi:hypothetical protein
MISLSLQSFICQEEIYGLCLKKEKIHARGMREKMDKCPNE